MSMDAANLWTCVCCRFRLREGKMTAYCSMPSFLLHNDEHFLRVVSALNLESIRHISWKGFLYISPPSSSFNYCSLPASVSRPKEVFGKDVRKFSIGIAGIDIPVIHAI